MAGTAEGTAEIAREDGAVRGAGTAHGMLGCRNEEDERSSGVERIRG
jgi:hypothetical protein